MRILNVNKRIDGVAPVTDTLTQTHTSMICMCEFFVSVSTTSAVLNLTILGCRYDFGRR